MSYKLFVMSTFRWTSVVTILMAGAVACRGEKKNQETPPTVGGATVVDTLAGDTTHTWDNAAGPLLAIQLDSGWDTVGIVGGAPQFDSATSATIPPTTLDLFGRSGLIGTTQLKGRVPGPGADDCDGQVWSRGRISGPKPGWSVGIESGKAVAIPLDSIESMRPADSAAFAATVTRLVSGARLTRDSMYSSVAFVVRRAYRFRAEGVEGIVALTERSIPSEANPRSELTSFVAERPAGGDAGYQIAYIDRTHGTENDVVAISPLAAVVLKETHRPAIVVQYEPVNGTSIGLIERIAPGKWRLRWQSVSEGCDD